MAQSKTKKKWIVGRIALFFCFILGFISLISAFASFSDNEASARAGGGLCLIASVFAFGIVVIVAYFSPIEQLSEQIQPTPVVNPKSKTQDRAIIEITAKSAKEAALQIVQYLNQARADGWTTGNAFALIDGWRNEYQIEKGDQKSVLKFDMRPTLKNVPSHQITMMTMVAAADDPDIEKKLSQLG
jgi:hypothetical protein